LQQSSNVYFLGKLISAEGNSMTADRLGSVRSGGPGGLGYQAQHPYGVEYTLTANDREKYATYTRDSLTGLDYAVNRYYSSQWGRFLSPDPSVNSLGLGDPQSWNRYAYAMNDPVNLHDPAGLGPCGWIEVENGPAYWVTCPDDMGEAGAGSHRPMSDSDQPGNAGGPSFPKCAGVGTQTQLEFVWERYAAATAEAATIQSQMPTLDSGSQVKANQTNLAGAFLDWSAWESGWGGSNFATSKNNYFGDGNVSFPSSMTWGAELAYILAIVPHTKGNPNIGNAPYSSFLVLGLTNNPNGSPAAILQSIANAGYNSADPNYGNTIAGPAGVNVQKMIDCLTKNGYM